MTEKLWQLPVSSWDIEAVNLCSDGLDVRLTYEFSKTVMGVTKYCIGGLIFKRVICHKHTFCYFFERAEYVIKSIEYVTSTSDSTLLKQLKKQDRKDFERIRPQHLTICIDGYGLYEFICKDFEPMEIVEKERDIEN